MAQPNPKATPLEALQVPPPQQNVQYNPDTIPAEMAGLSQVIEELSANEQHIPPPMNDPNMMIQLQHPPVLPNGANISAASPKSAVERILLDLKDSIVVFITFVLLGFEPISGLIGKVVGRLTENPYVLVAVKGVIAGIVFYAVKKLV
jgi:hypothetical protein